MANYSLEIGNALNAAWEYAKKYGLLIAVIYLLTDLLAGGLDQISGPSVNQEAYLSYLHRYQSPSNRDARTPWVS